MRIIYADFNDIDASGVLPLTARGSQDSIRELSDALHDGEMVLLTDGELWVVAVVHRADGGFFQATSDWRFQTEQPKP
jgi:hypothetical protein